ncbi:hypothetical protein ACE6H2_021256 [Prunus campanulata]
MEKYFGNAYRGDPGVPHADPERFVNIWIGWHDKAMCFEQYHWKKAMKKGEPYKFKWNQYMDKDLRDSYYFNWPVYFPYIRLHAFLNASELEALSFLILRVGPAEAKVGVNKPELLPKEFSPVIDVAGFLSDGQEKRLAQEIDNIEKDTGFKLRVLAQNYPDTPGLAIKDFWQVDDRTIVFVADPTFGNILNFNVGASIDLDVPRSFWSRLAGKYGNMFYWKEKGEDGAIEAAVMAISSCLKEPVGSDNCSEVK